MTPSAFDKAATEYDRWFDEHPLAYQSELEAVRHFIPRQGKGLEIGVGTGRFAQPLGIMEGVEASDDMALVAEKRGIRVHRAAAERLPFANGSYDFALMVNVVCFVNQPEDVFLEASRILKPGGRLIVAFIDRETELGQSYSSRSESKFYGAATFYSSAEIEAFFRKTRFISIQSCQTLFATPQLMQKPDLVLPGHGRGGFVVMSADKPSESS